MDISPINFSAIPVLPPYNESESEWLKTNASFVAQIAVNDSRASQMIREGATIAGVVYSCHPTPEGYTGPGCAPGVIAPKEAIEDLRELLRRDPLSRVGNLYRQRIVVFPDPHPDLSPRRRMPEGVGQKVRDGSVH